MALDGLLVDPVLLMVMLVLTLFMAACAALLLMESRRYTDTDKRRYPSGQGKHRA